jgi:hypothetical protein
MLFEGKNGKNHGGMMAIFFLMFMAKKKWLKKVFTSLKLS